VSVFHRYTPEHVGASENPQSEGPGNDGEGEGMLRFAAVKSALPPWDTMRDQHIDDDVLQAMAWTQVRTTEQMIAEREKAIHRIEARAEELMRSGQAKEWLKGADPQVANMSKEVNGPLYGGAHQRN
jgi:hypothetical protein